MELDDFAESWRTSSPDTTPPELEAGGLTRLLAGKAADVRRDARRRLRREAACYLPVLIISIAGFADGFGFRNLAMMSGTVVVLGSIMAALWHGERRLARVSLAGSVRETLAELVSTLSAAGRAYLSAYVALFVVTASIAAAVVWFRHGPGPVFVAVLLAGAGATIWSYRSGRAYVDRMFRNYRAELAECLRQLESPS